MNYNHLGPILTSKNHNNTKNTNPIKAPEKNILCAVTYNSSFLETDANTIHCQYDKFLVCDNSSFNEQIEKFMKLDEIKRTKTIYFHDKTCHNKAIVNNINAVNGEACVNLSY